MHMHLCIFIQRAIVPQSRSHALWRKVPSRVRAQDDHVIGRVFKLHAKKLGKGGKTAQSDAADQLRKVIKAIASIRSGGDFCVGDVESFPMPGLKIEGVGDVSLPLSPSQANAIKAVASQAPYGKGPETIVDIQVRNTLQVHPSKVTICNPKWDSSLKLLVETVCCRMGLEADSAEAKIYKYLLYEEGSHFKTHTDTEKETGMFGTLVVQFPCSYSGGSFIVRHGGVERTFNMGTNDESSTFSFHYIAHYADCEHQVMPLTSGYRFVAVYSLCLKSSGTVPGPPSSEPAQILAKFLPRKPLGILLAHRYTQHSLSRYGMRALKGIDRQLASTLLAASTLLKEQNASEELDFMMARVSRRRYYGERNNPPEPDHTAPIFNADGSECAHGLSRKVLGSFKFFDDIVNYREMEDEKVDLYGGPHEPELKQFYADYDTVEFEEVMEHMEKWWWDVGSVDTGNEGTEDDRIYHGYVLIFFKRDSVQSAN